METVTADVGSWRELQLDANGENPHRILSVQSGIVTVRYKDLPARRTQLGLSPLWNWQRSFLRNLSELDIPRACENTPLLWR